MITSYLRLRKPLFSFLKPRGPSCRCYWGFLLRSFKLDREGRASSASFTRRINSAAMAFDDCFRDRQSQTKASQQRRRPLLKHFKYFRQKVSLNSFPAVCDLKRYLFFALIKGPNGNCPAFGRELLSIF